MIALEELTLVESGHIKKWACLSCLGGCGEVISFSLSPNQRPRWRVTDDVWSRPTVNPAIPQKNACGCHFWIKNREINWCRAGADQGGSVAIIARRTSGYRAQQRRAGCRARRARGAGCVFSARNGRSADRRAIIRQSGPFRRRGLA
ncbi:DUF6527 family protein [Aliiroseovarius sediminis]|uniref:DUF6527 family protein n=1 Tax=Aliiroseovarius sediminis TaxID=2925839 RepID=UPI001F58BDD3|nr:DUF6527 family protein [Aliiroseovarius sediminis]MCI2393963.1 hypothetical protein [Aliiroseovarius sediminis]